jgi:hypothetical protein
VEQNQFHGLRIVRASCKGRKWRTLAGPPGILIWNIWNEKKKRKRFVLFTYSQLSAVTSSAMELLGQFPGEEVEASRKHSLGEARRGE